MSKQSGEIFDGRIPICSHHGPRGAGSCWASTKPSSVRVRIDEKRRWDVTKAIATGGFASGEQASSSSKVEEDSEEEQCAGRPFDQSLSHAEAKTRRSKQGKKKRERLERRAGRLEVVSVRHKIRTEYPPTDERLKSCDWDGRGRRFPSRLPMLM